MSSKTPEYIPLLVKTVDLRTAAGRAAVVVKPSKLYEALNVFWSAASGRWVADVPDLRSCSAHGDTPEEAVLELETAIELWVETAREEGIPVPEPSYRSEGLATQAA